MEQRQYFPSLFASGLAGLITASAVTITWYQNDLHSIVDWVIALSLLTLGFGLIYFIFLPRAWMRFREVSRQVEYWTVALIATFAICFSFAYGFLSFVAFLLIGFLLVSPGFASLQEFQRQKRAFRFIVAWAFGGVASFFALGFFKNFFPSLWEFVLSTALLNAVFTLIFEIILEQAVFALQNKPKEKLVSLAVLGLGILLVILTFRLLLQYPTLFKSTFFLPNPQTIPAFLGLTILSQSWIACLLQKLDSTDWRSSSFILWMKRNAPGLLLASAISISVFALATVLVSPIFGFTDNYFDTDSPIWINFLTADVDQVLDMRAVHPIVLLILRPPVWLLSLLLNGDKFHAAILLNSLMGGVCVYLAWLFFQQRTGNTAYSLLIATLLGVSTSHLLLSVFTESYIFSAVTLIAFILLLQAKGIRFQHFVSAGLVAFGILITNFLQTCIAFFLVRRDIKEVSKYVLVVLALAVPLSFTQQLLYPLSKPFYLAGNLAGESYYTYDLLEAPIETTYSRANGMLRSIAIFSVVAPNPLIVREEIGCSFPCFNTILDFGNSYQYASYTGFGDLLAKTWFVLLIFAGVIFAWQLFRSPKQTALQAALLVNIIFNFALHMNYGDDPMLYSPNWTYAIVLFFGISFERLADKKWAQSTLFILTAAILLNNLELFHKVLKAILPFSS